jgi:hypothetical protein
MSLQSAWMSCEMQDILYFGEGISTVRIMRLISHAPKKMMGKSDFTQ